MGRLVFVKYIFLFTVDLRSMNFKTPYSVLKKLILVQENIQDSHNIFYSDEAREIPAALLPSWNNPRVRAGQSDQNSNY